MHEVGSNGLSAQLRWAMQKGGPMYGVRWGSHAWVTNVKEVAEDMRNNRRRKGARREEAVK